MWRFGTISDLFLVPMLLRRSARFVRLFILVLSCGTANPLFAAPISGTISLSGNAPTGGVQIFYQARDISSEGEPNQSGFATIPAGSDSLQYTLDNVPDNPNALWRVQYSCGFTASCLDYVDLGYYSTGASENTSFDVLAATPVSQGSTNINMQVLDGTLFSGSMTLPSGVAPAEGVDFKIFIFDGSLTRNEDFTIEEGESSATFRMKMPASDTLDYVVRYSCPTLGNVSSYCFDNYVRNGLYRMGALGNAVASIDDADLLPAETPRTNLHMEFLTGTSISGRVSLPSGVAPAGGVTLEVSATDTTGGNLNSFRSVTIPANASFADYTLSVADDDQANWRVSYGCDATNAANNCDLYFRFGYYDLDDPVDTTTDSLSNADTLAGGTSHANINLTLLSALSISGMISIESPLFAPEGGLTLSISAQDANGGGVAVFTDVVIDAGVSSAPYTLTIPDAPGTNWHINYACKDPQIQSQCDEFERFGFYDSDVSGTTTNNSNETESLAGGIGHSNINLTVFTQPSTIEDSLCFPIKASNGNIAMVCL